MYTNMAPSHVNENKLQPHPQGLFFNKRKPEPSVATLNLPWPHQVLVINSDARTYISPRCWLPIQIVKSSVSSVGPLSERNLLNKYFFPTEGSTLETLDSTIRFGSTPTFSYFNLYLYSAYAGHYVRVDSCVKAATFGVQQHIFVKQWRASFR